MSRKITSWQRRYNRRLAWEAAYRRFAAARDLNYAIGESFGASLWFSGGERYRRALFAARLRLDRDIRTWHRRRWPPWE